MYFGNVQDKQACFRRSENWMLLSQGGETDSTVCGFLHKQLY